MAFVRGSTRDMDIAQLDKRRNLVCGGSVATARFASKADIMKLTYSKVVADFISLPNQTCSCLAAENSDWAVLE